MTSQSAQISALQKEIVDDARAIGHSPGDWFDDGYTSIKCDFCYRGASIDRDGNCLWDDLQNRCGDDR